MKPGEGFELYCLDFLTNTYGNKDVQFIRHNTADSTNSDIEVVIKGKSKFFIEVKDAAAQSGQFVLLPNDEAKSFTFSSRNKSQPNEFTNFIIEYMNKHYDRFSNAGTSGEVIDIDSDIFIRWIIRHYISQNAKYVISRGERIFICPIEKFGEYFSVSANFRTKKSGSKAPSEKYMPDVIDILKNQFQITDIYKKTHNGKRKLFVKASDNLAKVKFGFDKYTYYLSPQAVSEHFEIRQLSNTRNSNVIFTINVKKEQFLPDLKQFEADLL